MHEPLLRAIAANPDDREAYRVLADELQAAGDPRGELIALELARETEAVPIKLRLIEDAIRAHLRDHGAAILGPLRRWEHEPMAHWTWRRGFLEELRAYGVHDPDGRALLDTVFAHPAGALLRTLLVTGGVIDEALGQLADGAPQSLRTLTVSCERPASAARIWQRFPYLETLHFVRCLVDADEMPTVRHATLLDESIVALAARWPALERLALTTYRVPHREEVRQFLDSPHAPRLTRFAFQACPYLSALLEWLPSSRLGAQLEDLDVGSREIDDAFALAWVQLPRLPRLRTLRVVGHRMSGAGIRALAEIADRVITRQKDDV